MYSQMLNFAFRFNVFFDKTVFQNLCSLCLGSQMSRVYGFLMNKTF